jgi:hypothetical protein
MGPARECRKMLRSLSWRTKCPVGRDGSRGYIKEMKARGGLVIDGSAHGRYELAI